MLKACTKGIECEGWRQHSSLIFLILLFTKPNIEVSGWLYQTKTHFTHIVYQPFSRVSPQSFTLYGLTKSTRMGTWKPASIIRMIVTLIECERWRRHSWKRLINNVSEVCFGLILPATNFYIFGLVNSSIKKMRLECLLHPSHSMPSLKASLICLM